MYIAVRYQPSVLVIDMLPFYDDKMDATDIIHESTHTHTRGRVVEEKK